MGRRTEHPEWIDFKKPVPELVDVERKWDTHIQAESPLFYNVPWCSSWAHGPDIMLPALGLAERILQPGEYIKQMTSIQFLRPITHDIITYVYDQPTKTIDKNAKDASVRGLLETSSGRILQFDIVENINSPISDHRGRNPIGSELLIAKGNDWAYFTFINEKVQWKYVQPLADFMPLRTSTTLEILTMIATHIFDKEIRPAIRVAANWPICMKKMVAKVTNMPTDMDLFSYDKSNGMVARARLDKIRKSPGGWEILPIEFHFSPEQEKPCALYFLYKVETE